MCRKRKRQESIGLDLEDPLGAHEVQELPLSDTEHSPALAALEPPSPQTLPSIIAPLPLTKSNLRRLEGSGTTSNMGGKGSTSKKSRTDSEMKEGSSKSSKPSAQEIRDALEEHNFLINDTEAREAHPEVIKEAERVINGKRGSAMGDDERKKSARKLEDQVLSNEATFMDIMWWQILYKDARMVPRDDMREAKREDLKDDEWMSRDWDLDFLVHNRDKIFRKGCLPPLTTDDPTVKQLIERIPRLKTPKPDLVFGLDKLAFTESERRVNKAFPMFTDLSPTRYHPFFVVEHKSHNASIEDAKNQASRSGGALLYALRKLEDQTSKKSIRQGADDRTWLFTLALDTGRAALFVNWVFVKDGTEVYHMHKLDEYLLHSGGDLADLRKHIGNILEWGVGERLETIKLILAKVYKNMPKQDKKMGEKRAAEVEESEDSEDEDE